jgi:hypothetical protein
LAVFHFCGKMMLVLVPDKLSWVAKECKDDSLDEAVELALQCGATKSDVQYYDTSTVMFDPAGHPFCLSTISQ